MSWQLSKKIIKISQLDWNDDERVEDGKKNWLFENANHDSN